MEYVAASRTDIGRVRKNNEDYFFSDANRGIFIVADGMGGHKAGEVASRIAVETTLEELKKADLLRDRLSITGAPQDGEALVQAVAAAVELSCLRVFEKASADAICAGMGTTLSLIVLAGRKGVLAHVGDSRVYVLRKNAFYQLSEDHSFVAEQVRRGIISKEEAAHSQYSNVLTRALGVAASTQVDTLLFDVDPGDRFLLCSDGLHNYFDDGLELAEALRQHAPEKALDVAIDKAKERGGKDNITAIIVEAVAGDDAIDLTQTAASRIAVLKKIPLFVHLRYPELVKVISIMQVRHHEAGHRLIGEEDLGEELFVTLSGELEVISGGKVIANLPPGVHVGEMALIDKAPRSATVVCKTAVNLLAMDRTHFYELIRREPTVGTKLLWSFTQTLSRRLRDTTQNLKQAMEELHERSETVEELVPFAPRDDGEVVVGNRQKP